MENPYCSCKLNKVAVQVTSEHTVSHMIKKCKWVFQVRTEPTEPTPRRRRITP